MRALLFLYTSVLLAGGALGFIFPTLMPTWFILLCVPGIIIVTELAGWWGFGNRWYDYRNAVYFVYPVMAACALLGILLGSGKVVAFLVALGLFISR